MICFHANVGEGKTCSLTGLLWKKFKISYFFQEKFVDSEHLHRYNSIPIDILRMYLIMRISKKCQYGLKAVFELARRDPEEPVKTHVIAGAQGMSTRFTEIILNELKHGGFVESRRGNKGGYLLARDAKDLTVGEIIEYIEGMISVAPEAIKANTDTAFFGKNSPKSLICFCGD